MNFISKKYVLSALVICASFGSGFTSDTCYKQYYNKPFSKINTSHTNINDYNKHDPYFVNIRDTSDLLLKKFELQACNKSYERLVTPKKNNKYQKSNLNEHNNISNIDDQFNNLFKLFNKTFNEVNSFSDWLNMPFNNIWQGCNQIFQKFGEHFSNINKYFSDIMNQCIKQNNNYHTEPIYDKNNNVKGYKIVYYDENNNVKGYKIVYIDKSNNNRCISAYSCYNNNNIYPNQNNDGVYENNIVEDNSLDKTRDEDYIKKELEQLEKYTNEMKNLNKTNNNSILIYPSGNKDNNTQNINQQGISNSEWDNIEDDLINNEYNTNKSNEVNSVSQNPNSINPVLDNKTSVVINDEKEKVNKINDIDKKKLHKYNVNKHKNNKNYKVINAENVQINSNEVNNNIPGVNNFDDAIENCKNEKADLKVEYDKRINTCQDKNRAQQLEKVKEALLEEKDKEIESLEKAKEKKVAEIKKASDEAKNLLFIIKYNKRSKQFNDGTLKYNKDILKKLVNSKEQSAFDSADKKAIDNLINLQYAVSQAEKNPKNTEALNAEKINTFLAYIKTCNKEQLNNISMIYYQIYLHVSGKKNKIKKINQTVDLFKLKNLLLCFNDNILASENIYYNNLNNELIYAIINHYIDSNKSIDDCIKQLLNNKDILLNKYIILLYTKNIYNQRINKQTDIEENGKSLKMFDNITPEQWKEATEAAVEYIKAFDIFVNIVNQYKEIY